MFFNTSAGDGEANQEAIPKVRLVEICDGATSPYVPCRGYNEKCSGNITDF